MTAISDASNCCMAGSTVRITVVSRLKNAGMYAAAKQLGNQAKLARRLGVTEAEVSKWCNMQACPPKEPRGDWTQERIDKLESDLLEITGLLLDDIFPDTLRENTKFLNAPKAMEHTREIELEGLMRLAENYAERIDVQPLRIASQAELSSDIAESLKQLSSREREIIERRFALNGRSAETYEEVGKHLRITKERVRQLEMRALLKLKEIGGVLLSHMEDAVPSM